MRRRKYSTEQERIAAKKEQRRRSSLKYARKNKEKISAYGRLYRQQNKDKLNSKARVYLSSNPEKRKQYRAAHNMLNRKKFLARRLTSQAIYKGNLKKLPCCICKVANAQAHHLDYSNWKNIMWLCKPHHYAWHRVFVAENQ